MTDGGILWILRLYLFLVLCAGSVLLPRLLSAMEGCASYVNWFLEMVFWNFYPSVCMKHGIRVSLCTSIVDHNFLSIARIVYNLTPISSTIGSTFIGCNAKVHNFVRVNLFNNNIKKQIPFFLHSWLVKSFCLYLEFLISGMICSSWSS